MSTVFVVVVTVAIYATFHLYFYFTSQRLLSPTGFREFGDPRDVNVVIYRHDDPIWRQPLVPDNASTIVLRYRPFSVAVIAKALVATSAGWWAVIGLSLSPLFATFSLLVIVEPIAFPWHRMETKQSGLLIEASAWLASELRIYIQRGLLLSPFIAFFWLTGLDYNFGVPEERYGDWLKVLNPVLGWPQFATERLNGSLTLPLGFYLIAAAIFIYKIAALNIALGWGAVRISLVGIVCAGAFSAVHAITGRVEPASVSWDQPFVGFLANILFRFGWDWSSSRLDLSSEDTSS